MFGGQIRMSSFETRGAFSFTFSFFCWQQQRRMVNETRDAGRVSASFCRVVVNLDEGFAAARNSITISERSPPNATPLKTEKRRHLYKYVGRCRERCHNKATYILVQQRWKKGTKRIKVILTSVRTNIQLQLLEQLWYIRTYDNPSPDLPKSSTAPRQTNGKTKELVNTPALPPTVPRQALDPKEMQHGTRSNRRQVSHSCSDARRRPKFPLMLRSSTLR